MLLSFLASSCSRKKENTIPQKAKSAERDKIKGFCMTHTYKARQKSSEGLFTFDVFSESRVMYSEIWKDIMRAISLYISTVNMRINMNMKKLVHEIISKKIKVWTWKSYLYGNVP